MVRFLRIVIGTVAVCSLFGCSSQDLKRSGYETLHNISDIQNRDDPKYDPGPHPSFETYQQQREEMLKHERPETPTPAVPAAPPGE